MTIQFNIESTDVEKISEFELGNITIEQSKVIITSKRENAPYQDFMLFPTLTNFLYDLRNSISKNQKKVSFIALDSSFEFHLRICKNSIVLDEKIEVSLNLFLNTLYNASLNLYQSYKDKVDDSSNIFDELKVELENLEKILNVVR